MHNLFRHFKANFQLHVAIWLGSECQILSCLMRKTWLSLEYENSGMEENNRNNISIQVMHLFTGKTFSRLCVQYLTFPGLKKERDRVARLELNHIRYSLGG